MIHLVDESIPPEPRRKPPSLHRRGGGTAHWNGRRVPHSYRSRPSARRPAPPPGPTLQWQSALRIPTGPLQPTPERACRRHRGLVLKIAGGRGVPRVSPEISQCWPGAGRGRVRGCRRTRLPQEARVRAISASISLARRCLRQSTMSAFSKSVKSVRNRRRSAAFRHCAFQPPMSFFPRS